MVAHKGLGGRDPKLDTWKVAAAIMLLVEIRASTSINCSGLASTPFVVTRTGRVACLAWILSLLRNDLPARCAIGLACDREHHIAMPPKPQILVLAAGGYLPAFNRHLVAPAMASVSSSGYGCARCVHQMP